MNLCVIPARAGSKGLLNKNMRLFNGKPLVQHIIDEALRCEFDKVVVTTDIENLLDLVSSYGTKRLDSFYRAENLCDDDIPIFPVVLDAWGRMEATYDKVYDVITTLQPTSPFLNNNHIREAHRRFLKTKANSLLSVREELHSIWKTEGGIVTPVSYQKVCRQKAHPYYVGNGAIFITDRETLLEGDRLGGKIELYLMNELDSFDIHTQEDLENAEWLKSMRCS